MAQEIVFGSEDSEVVEAPKVDTERKNVQRKNVIVKANKIGTVAHYHKNEDEIEIWDEPCLFVEHVVNVPKGLDINGEIYSGKVVVPSCTAGVLGQMENAWEHAEQSL